MAVLTEPPVIVGGEREFGGFDWPVELWDHVVQPAVLQPFEGVGREFFIGVEASAGAGRNIRAPETEGTDAKLDPFLGGFDAIVEFVNEGVDVLPAPVAFVEGATGGLIRFVRGVIRERDHGAIGGFDGVGVKIVVDVDAVDIVTACDVEHDGNGLRPDFGNAGIHPFVDAVRHCVFG